MIDLDTFWFLLWIIVNPIMVTIGIAFTFAEVMPPLGVILFYFGLLGFCAPAILDVVKKNRKGAKNER